MFAHLPLACILQLLTILVATALGVTLVPAAWLGCFCAIAVCVTREITQREYQWIEKFGNGLRRNMPAFAGYRFWEWNRHSKRETIAAALLVIATSTAVTALH
jgi:apolipoprotein N-acyltransferase